MAVGVQSGSVNVNGTVTAVGTFTPTKNTAAFAMGAAANQTTTIGTVPASKVWRIIGVALSLDVSVNSGQTAILNLAGSPILELRGVADAASAAGGAGGYSMAFDYTACPVLTAGQTATVVSNHANAFAYGTIVYVEEAA